jgi:hypothetical protein
VRQHRCAAMHAGEHAITLPRLHLVAQWVWVTELSVVVATVPPDTSPPVTSPMCVRVTCGTSGPTISHMGLRLGASPGVPSVFSSGFLKGFQKWIFRNYWNALEIHNLKNMAPKFMKQILLWSLWLDIQFKNVACQMCDTFL